jgi:hypothetical protein
MLINERKLLGTDALSEADLLERELERGVIVEYDPVIDREHPAVEEAHTDTILGGLVSAEEHVHTREAQLDPIPAANIRLIK